MCYKIVNMMKKYCLKGVKRAFTLAEVLITLGIIGVVAALTIPTLINNYNESSYNTMALKAYSNLSNAYKQILANNGNTLDVSSSLALRTQFASVMDFVETPNCNSAGCFATMGVTNGYKTVAAQSSGNVPISVAYYPATLKDGSFIGFTATAPVDLGGGVYHYGYIIIDVNGIKGPNQYANDLLHFWIRYKNNEYSILPAGDGEWGTSCAAGYNLGCTAVRLHNPQKLP